MRPRLFVTAFVVLACASAGACTSGGGGSGYPSPVPGGGGNEPGGSTYEPPGTGSGQDPKGSSGNEPGGSTYEPPGESSSGGTSSGGGSGGGSGSGGEVCLACSTYNCRVVTPQGTGSSTIVLTPNSGGGCVEASVGDILLCDGTVVVGSDDAGTVIGSWTSTGLGGFTASVEGVSFTCTLAAASGSGGFSPPVDTEDAG